MVLISWRGLMKKIKDLRLEHSISQKDLADTINVTQASISRWEKNQRSISGANLIKLSQYFNVSIDDLLGINIDKEQ